MTFVIMNLMSLLGGKKKHPVSLNQDSVNLLGRGSVNMVVIDCVPDSSEIMLFHTNKSNEFWRQNVNFFLFLS